jgi:hypothetical protein
LLLWFTVAKLLYKLKCTTTNERLKKIHGHICNMSYVYINLYMCRYIAWNIT